MSERNTTVSFSGIFIPLLTVLFVALKLTDHIDWSWWWVLSPLWIGAAAAIVICSLVLLVALFTASKD